MKKLLLLSLACMSYASISQASFLRRVPQKKSYGQAIMNNGHKVGMYLGNGKAKLNNGNTVSVLFIRDIETIVPKGTKLGHVKTSSPWTSGSVYQPIK